MLFVRLMMLLISKGASQQLHSPASTIYRSCGNNLRGLHSPFAAVAVVRRHGGAGGANKTVWRPLKMEQQFVVKGGMCNKPYVLDTMPVLVSGKERHFCRILKSETWLLKCGAGAGAQNGILTHVKGY